MDGVMVVATWLPILSWREVVKAFSKAGFKPVRRHAILQLAADYSRLADEPHGGCCERPRVL